MYKIQPTSKFKKDLKVIMKQKLDLSLLDEVVTKLANGETLSEKYLDHALKGKRKGYRDCHITPDWVLVYKINKDVLTLVLAETGSHSDLF